MFLPNVEDELLTKTKFFPAINLPATSTSKIGKPITLSPLIRLNVLKNNIREQYVYKYNVIIEYNFFIHKSFNKHQLLSDIEKY